MKYLEVFFWVVWGLLFISVEAEIPSDRFYKSIDAVQKDHHGSSNIDCPGSYGAFPDPDDCSKYYVCISGVAVHKKCKNSLNFDIYRKRCVPKFIATCGNSKGTTRNQARSIAFTSASTGTSTTGSSFKCSRFRDLFPDPNDCSKYYECKAYRLSHKTCPSKQLFDAVKKLCQPAKKVHCGTRQKPQDFTTAISTESTTKITTSIPTESTTRSTIREIPETTTESTVSEMLTETTESTTESTTEVITSTIQSTTEDITTTYRPTGPPDHTCEEEDVDCIITETGDANDWFICPQDIGSYAHPSSDRLFIFCMNWIPSVKKCGQNLVFSKELSTCTDRV